MSANFQQLANFIWSVADLLSSLSDGWQRVQLKTICDFAVSNVDKHTFDDESPVRLCHYTDVYKNDRVSPDMDLMAATTTRQGIDRFHLEIGDVVITKDSESWYDIAVSACVEGTTDDFVCGYHLAFIRPKKGVLEPSTAKSPSTRCEAEPADHRNHHVRH